MSSQTETMSAAIGSTVEWHTDIAAIAREWDDLADRAAAPPFLRPGWLVAWLGAWGDSPRILALRERGELRAVLPLVRRRGVVSAAANSHTPLAGAVVEDPSYLHQLARAVVAGRAPRTDLRSLDPRDPLAVEFRAAALARGHSMIERLTDREPYVELPGDFEEYEA